MKKQSAIKTIAFILALGLLLPTRGVIPVQNATAKDWNASSFWFAPWGKSGVHKGIDIFAKRGTPVLASTSGWVIYRGNSAMGGNVIAVLGPKWRIYYYAHMQNIIIKSGDMASKSDVIGSVGDSGNAKAGRRICTIACFHFCPTLGNFRLARKVGKRCFL